MNLKLFTGMKAPPGGIVSSVVDKKEAWFIVHIIFVLSITPWGCKRWFIPTTGGR
jgi:hypothetical protein